MGIDARILLRGISDKVFDAQIKAWSWDLCASIGARHFFIDTEKGRGAICKTGSRYREDGDPAPGTVYIQDGDDIVAAAGECLLEVHVWTRYYGIGYERGDLITLCAIAEWCEANIPGVSVWYGGDSSGVCAAPWTEIERTALRRHLYSEEGRAYAYAACPPEQKPRIQECSLCVPDRGMTQCGWGGAGLFESHHCKGCGRTFETHDGRKSWQVKEPA